MQTNPQVLARLAALIATAAAVTPPVAAQSKPDSTQQSAQGPLTPSNCPNVTYQWYAAGTVPAGYYKANADGNCYAIPSCTYGWDSSAQTCASASSPAPAPTPVPAPPPAPTPAPASMAPTVALSLPSAAQAEGSASASWSVSGAPAPTAVSIGCYPAAGGALLASWASPLPPTSASLMIPDAMVGNDVCVASVSTSAGIATSTPTPMNVSCPSGKAWDVATRSCSTAPKNDLGFGSTTAGWSWITQVAGKTGSISLTLRSTGGWNIQASGMPQARLYGGASSGTWTNTPGVSYEYKINSYTASGFPGNASPTAATGWTPITNSTVATCSVTSQGQVTCDAHWSLSVRQVGTASPVSTVDIELDTENGD